MLTKDQLETTKLQLLRQLGEFRERCEELEELTDAQGAVLVSIGSAFGCPEGATPGEVGQALESGVEKLRGDAMGVEQAQRDARRAFAGQALVALVAGDPGKVTADVDAIRALAGACYEIADVMLEVEVDIAPRLQGWPGEGRNDE